MSIGGRREGFDRYESTNVDRAKQKVPRPLSKGTDPPNRPETRAISGLGPLDRVAFVLINAEGGRPDACLSVRY